jgi:hypothetical protein
MPTPTSVPTDTPMTGGDPMPVFVIKAKDKLAASTIECYLTYCEDEGLDEQAEEVRKAIAEFEAWQARNPAAMKLPDHSHRPVSVTSEAASAGRTAAVLDEVAAELRRAEAKFPDQHLPDGGGDPRWAELRDAQRAKTDRKLADGTATWLDVVLEETYEAFAEVDPVLLRAELVQVAAMAIRWINDIDQRAFVAATA